MPATDIQVRPAALHDLKQIKALDVFAGERSREIEAGEVLVAVIGDKVAGYISHNKKFFQRPFVWYLCVHGDHRRSGIAQLLWAAVEDIYRPEGFLFSSTEADNHGMIRFFEKNGYVPSGSIDNMQQEAELVFFRRF